MENKDQIANKVVNANEHGFILPARPQPPTQRTETLLEKTDGRKKIKVVKPKKERIVKEKPEKQKLEKKSKSQKPIKPQKENKTSKQTNKEISKQKSELQSIDDNLKENSTKKLHFKKIIIILSSVAVIMAVIAVGIIIAVNNFKKNAQLQIPAAAPALSVLKSQDDYYIIAPLVMQADIYIFEIKSPDNQAITLSSKSNVALVTGAFNIKQSYLIRFSVQKQGNDKTRSKSTDWVNFTASARLLQPQVDFNAETQTLIWHAILNADFYNLYYSTKDGVQVKTISTPPNQEGKIEVELGQLELEYGKYEFSVVAASNNASVRLPSEASAKIKVDFFYKLPKVDKATYNFESNILIVELKEKIEDIKIKIVYEGGSFTFSPTNSLLKYELNLSDFNNLSFESGQEIFVSLTLNQQFVVESDKVKIGFEN